MFVVRYFTYSNYYIMGGAEHGAIFNTRSWRDNCKGT